MLYQILPKKDFQFSLENLTMFFKNVGSSKERLSLKNIFTINAFDYQYIIDCDSSHKINFYLKVNDRINQDVIINAVNVWLANKAVIFPSDHILEHYSTIDTLANFNDYNQNQNHKNKLATFNNDTIFMNILAMMQPYTRITIDFRITNVAIFDSVGTRFLSRGAPDVELETLIQIHGHTKYSRTNAMNIANSICSLTAAEKKLCVKFKNKFIPIRLTSSELANIFQLPTLFRKEDEIIENISYLFPGQVTLKKDEYISPGIYAGKNYHPIQSDRDVFISYDQMRKHGFISGTTGSGKSSALEEWIDHILAEKLKNIDAPGCTFFDPLESSVLGIIDKILKLKDDGHDISELLKRVRYIDFSTDDYIFPISLLNSNTSDPTELLDFFKSLYGDQNTIQVDRMMTSAIQALLQDTHDHSIFDIQEIFNAKDDSYRQELIRRLSKNIYASDEIKFLKGKFNQSAVDPILNRLDPFRNTRQKKLMFGLPKKYDCLKDIRKWMDQGYIILFNLKGLSKFDIKVICGYLSTQYYLTALSRPDFSKIHFLIADEAHDVQMPIFPKIGAKCRKSGLALFIITQFIEQFDPDYLLQLMGNMNTFISFKQKEKAAMSLQRLIPSQDVSKSDLMKLPTFVGYLSTEENNKERSILIKVKPPYRYTDGKLVDHNNEKAVQENLDKNRKFAHELMKRDFISREDAEKIVFADHFQSLEKDELEKELLSEGDSLVRAEDSNKTQSEGGILWDD